MFKVYVLIVPAVILFSESFSHEVAMFELISAMKKIAIAGEMRTKCNNDTECLKSEQCTNGVCVDPCPGSCGIKALCHVTNHTLSCECPRCYAGYSYERCIKYPGFLYKWCILMF